jgi:gamma-glutamyltranspeptidase/glutathione hydrolase
MQEIFGLLELHDSELREMKPNSADYIHLVTECCKHAFADRSEWLADPDFIDVPVARLTDSRYVDELSQRIDMQHTLDNPFDYGSIVSAENPNPLNDHGTSHFSVIDASGMAVACTETINLNFGSLVEVAGYGFFLNDEMDDFTTIVGEPNAFGLRQSEKNLPQARKRPLSSMSPTIMVKDGQVVLIAGASGGPRIITGTVQAMLNCLLFDMSPASAVGLPRFHHQWMPNVLRFEKGCADAGVQGDLRKRGHEMGAIDVVAQVQLIMVGPDGIRAASDPRKGGAPAGY